VEWDWSAIGLPGGWGGLHVLAVGVVTATVAIHLGRITGRRTRRRLLDPGPLRVVLRGLRFPWLRLAAAIGAWPHMLLTLTGLRVPGGMATHGPAWRLGRFGPRLLAPGWDGRTNGQVPVLLVHALVTRPWILDLTPRTSLVRALARTGRPVFVLDWDSPTVADRHRTLQWSAEWVRAAEREVCGLTGSSRVHLVGYCSGGTVALLRAATAPPEALASVACIATPIDPHAGGMLSWMAHPDLPVGWLVDARGLVPGVLIRESFHWLRPRALRTVLGRLRMGRRGPGAAEADALTAWLWDHPDLPGGLLFDMVDLARNDGLRTGRGVGTGPPVNLSSIRVPVARFRASHDHIVPDRDSGLPGWYERECAGGHIGMVLGTRGTPSLHDELPAWWEAVERALADSLDTCPPVSSSSLVGSSPTR
jgi:polyhydroxyalkanoate synthase subunit PhaC